MEYRLWGLPIVRWTDQDTAIARGTASPWWGDAATTAVPGQSALIEVSFEPCSCHCQGRGGSRKHAPRHSRSSVVVTQHLKMCLSWNGLPPQCQIVTPIRLPLWLSVTSAACILLTLLRLHGVGREPLTFLMHSHIFMAVLGDSPCLLS